MTKVGVCPAKAICARSLQVEYLLLNPVYMLKYLLSLICDRLLTLKCKASILSSRLHAKNDQDAAQLYATLVKAQVGFAVL